MELEFTELHMFFPDAFNKDKYTVYRQLNWMSFREYKLPLPLRRGSSEGWAESEPVALPF